MKLLLIEDDRSIGDLLTDALTTQHWVVERATDGESGLERANTQDYDLIVLDIGLPKLDGITVCKQLRSRGCQTPILVLTGQNSTEVQIAGLDAGADDYVTKPFNLDIVLARVRAIARKGKSVAPALTWETIQLDPANSEVTCNGTPIHLTAKEYGLLKLFLLNPKRIYSRRAILDDLWDCADSPGGETVSTRIKCVRQKLKAASASDPIETVHGLGYRLRSAPSPSVSPSTAPNVKPPQSVQSDISVSVSDRPTPQQKAQAVTSKVWNRFKAQYLEQIEILEKLVNTLQPGVVSIQQQESQHIAHKLVGSMGMFGLLEASQKARKLEQLMQSSSLDTTQITEASQWVNSLKQAIAQAQVDLPPKLEPLSAQTGVTDSGDGTDSGKRVEHETKDFTFNPLFPLSNAAHILIVDDDLLLAERLRIEAIAWKLQVEVATDLTVARQMIAQTPPSIILLDLSFPGEDTGLTLMHELEQRSPSIPVVIFTAREDLRDRVAVARLGATAFLHKPLPAHEILKTVTDVLRRMSYQPEKDHLLIVDDDPGFLHALSARLSAHGLQVTTSADPQQFWQVLASCTPNVLLLDLEMPEFDGVELCQVVRADPQWQHLKVLFLSAHTEPDTLARAYAAGADDYISKTLPATDLVTRILYRVSLNTV